MIICKDNKIFIWGSTNEGFMTFNDTIKETRELNQFHIINNAFYNQTKLKEIIDTQIADNDFNYTQVFIESILLHKNIILLC